MRSLDIPLADTFVDTMSGLIVECKKRIFSEALDPASVNPHFATLRNAFNLTVQRWECVSEIRSDPYRLNGGSQRMRSMANTGRREPYTWRLLAVASR